MSTASAVTSLLAYPVSREGTGCRRAEEAVEAVEAVPTSVVEAVPTSVAEAVPMAPAEGVAPKPLGRVGAVADPTDPR